MILAATNGSEDDASEAFLYLKLALGQKRVPLSELRPNELQALLESELKRCDFNEMSGFKELKDTLSRGGEQPLRVHLTPKFFSQEFSHKNPLNLKSHTVRVCRGVLSQELTYRRYETGEETTDHALAREWARSAYVYRGEESLLLMRKLPDFWEDMLDELLVQVTYGYIKVPNKEEYVIDEISAKQVPVSGFCQHFGEKAPEAALHMLWELSSIYRLTAKDLQSKADRFQGESSRRERLAGSVG